MAKIQITMKQHEDIGAFFDLVKSDSGIIEGFFVKPDGHKITGYFAEKQAFIESVAAYNYHGFTCYAGVQPRKAALLKADRSATGADVTALRLLAVDLDTCKPLDEAGNKMKVNASDSEKSACLMAARDISMSLTNGNMGYLPPILMDSGSGCWLFMPIPEILIHDGNRREISIRLKAWGRKFRERFQRDGIDIDESIFELHRLTKIPGTRVFSYPNEPDRPQRISGFLSEASPRPDEKLQHDFLTMPVAIPLERNPDPGSCTRAYNNPDRLFERCYLLKFLAEKGASGISMPHGVRLALSTISLPLGDLKNNLSFIRRIIGGCPDFSESKTRRYLELNQDKSQPYGCNALRNLAIQHFKDFDASQCQCALPVSHDHSGKPRKPSPIRFAGILPDDLPDIFSELNFSGDAFQDSLKLKKFSEDTLTNVDATTAKSFLESVSGELKMSRQGINDLLKARKLVAAEDTTQAQRLINLAKDAELFKTPDDQIFATAEVNGHRETWPAKSSGFRNWLKHQYYRESGKPPSNQPLQDALGILEAKGQFEGLVHPVFIRIASYGDNIYIDLANDRWEAIEITPSGWNVVQGCPVRFRRTRGMSPLPKPVKGRTLKDLIKYLNLSSEDDFKLIVSWMVATLKPTGPYPVLVFNGEQGTAKSTISRIIKSLIDPSSSPLRTTPTEVRDLMIGANNNWILAFDNLSGLPTWLSDGICRLATGGGFSTRELYSDDQEVIFNAMRGVILNGIEDIVTRHDLADRSIIVNLSPIPESKRIAEKDLWEAFDSDAPGILGALCNAASCALRNFRAVKLDRLPRMADFALWVTSAEPALPWPEGQFMLTYHRNLKEVVEQTLDADVVASAVRSYVQDHPEGFLGTPSELLKILSDLVDEKISRAKSWPKAPHILTGKLKRGATSLRAFGIEVKTGFRLPDKSRGIRIKSNGNALFSQDDETAPEAAPVSKENVRSISVVTDGGTAGDGGDASLDIFSQASDEEQHRGAGDAGTASLPSHSERRVKVEI